MSRVRPPRTAAELEATKLRNRRKRRIAMGWPADRLDDPPRSYVRGGAQAAPKDDHPDAKLVDSPAGHELYDDARRALTGYERAELGAAMDSTARDLLQEFVLASLEGRDPGAAVKAFRMAAYKDRFALVRSTNLVTDLVR